MRDTSLLSECLVASLIARCPVLIRRPPPLFDPSRAPPLRVHARGLFARRLDHSAAPSPFNPFARPPIAVVPVLPVASCPSSTVLVLLSSGVAYSSVSVGATAKYDKVSSTSTAHPTATGITGYDEPASIWNANFGSWVPNLGNLTDLSPSSSASISTPLVVTTEGGVWISGSYAGASFVGSASVLLGGGTSSSASSAAYGYKKSGKPR